MEECDVVIDEENVGVGVEKFVSKVVEICVLVAQLDGGISVSMLPLEFVAYRHT